MGSRESIGWHSIAVAILSLASVAGCATPTDDIPDQGTAYDSLEKFCHTRAVLECSPAVVKACQSGSTEACVGLREASCIDGAPQGTTYVSTHAPECLTLVEQMYSTTILEASEVEALSTACVTDLFTGPGPARAPCTTSLDCDTVSGLECIVPFGSSNNEGKCLVPKNAGSGMPCTGEADRCQTGFYCDPLIQVCTPSAPVGQTCAGNFPGACVSGAECQGGGLIQAPWCVELAPPGAHCVEDTDCAAGLCDRPAANGNGTCTETLELVAIAASCQGFRP